MKYSFDTEFIEDGRTIDLISIGIVAEDGRELYRQNAECDFTKANDFVRENVLPKLADTSYRSGRMVPLLGRPTFWATRKEIAIDIMFFVEPERYGKPEFWGYYAAYDWVALCQLYGTMVDLPGGWPMHCNDLKQWANALGNRRLPEEGKGEHNALHDARWNWKVYQFLRDMERPATIGRERLLVELLADAEHASWARWMDYLFGRCKALEDGSLVIASDDVAHWRRQIQTPYADLSDIEKESDRAEVRRILPIIWPPKG